MQDRGPCLLIKIPPVLLFFFSWCKFPACVLKKTIQSSIQISVVLTVRGVACGWRENQIKNESKIFFCSGRLSEWQPHVYCF